MKIQFEKRFLKDIKLLKDKNLKEEILTIISQVENAKKLDEIKNLKKLKGFKNCYRIRTGDFRIGIYFQSNIIEFVVFGHRKSFYRYFPK